MRTRMHTSIESAPILLHPISGCSLLLHPISGSSFLLHPISVFILFLHILQTSPQIGQGSAGQGSMHITHASGHYSARCPRMDPDFEKPPVGLLVISSVTPAWQVRTCAAGTKIDSMTHHRLLQVSARTGKYLALAYRRCPSTFWQATLMHTRLSPWGLPRSNQRTPDSLGRKAFRVECHMATADVCRLCPPSNHASRVQTPGTLSLFSHLFLDYHPCWMARLLLFRPSQASRPHAAESQDQARTRSYPSSGGQRQQH